MVDQCVLEINRGPGEGLKIHSVMDFRLVSVWLAVLLLGSIGGQSGPPLFLCG